MPAPVKAHPGLLGAGPYLGRSVGTPALQLAAGAHRCPVMPGRLDKQPSRVGVEPPWFGWRLVYKLFMDVRRSAGAPKKAGWTASGGPQGRWVWS